MHYIDYTDKGKNPENNPLLLFIIFILVANRLKSKNRFLNKEESESLDNDEYMVEMSNTPAFPLENIEDNTRKSIEKKPVLKVNNSEEFYLMLDKMKPYMSPKNRSILSIFEKWKNLVNDLSALSNSKDTMNTNNLSNHQQKNIVDFLHDLKPFVDENYYTEIDELSNGINTITKINKNIVTLQNTLQQINTMNDNTEKIHRLVDALHPFMDESQKKSIDQLKNISMIMDTLKSVEAMSKTSNGNAHSNETSSNIMEILDILGSNKDHVPDASQEHKTSWEKNSSMNTRNTNDFESIFEEELSTKIADKENLEEIFEEGPEVNDE